MGRRWQRRTAIKTMNYLLSIKQDDSKIQFEVPSVDIYNIEYYDGVESEKPEIKIHFYDCCADIFINTKHVCGNIRCWCFAEVKDHLKSLLKGIRNEKANSGK